MSVDLTTSLGSLQLSAPTLTASGCAAAGKELAQFGDVSTFGQDMFTSNPSTPSTLARIRASSPNSSTLLPAIETMVVTLFARSHAKSFSKKESMPGPCKPMELSMPLGVSAMRGVARPDRGAIMMLLVTTAPSVETSPNCASSLPAAAQPDAVNVGAAS